MIHVQDYDGSQSSSIPLLSLLINESILTNVFNKPKNFASDGETRMPQVPLN